jgi:pantoate--beta-alanine ligase
MNPALARSRAELAAARAGLRGPVVLVPTMGALHDGHRALLRRARELAGEAGSVIVSIFVNPLQFGPGEDLDRYPRTLEADMAVCRDEGAALVFAPGPAEIFPAAPAITIDPGPVGTVLEGEFRPGFFRGVLTVVIKLMGLVRPDIAVFGEKDRQQLALVRRMAADLDTGVEIAAVPTVREPDGLATSSRNRYLSLAERRTALSLPGALRAAAAEAPAGAAKALAAARFVLDEAAHADPPLRVDYLVLADPVSFAPLDEGHTGAAVLAVAARVGSTRLIDNVGLTLQGAAGHEAAGHEAAKEEAADDEAAGPGAAGPPAPGRDPAEPGLAEATGGAGSGAVAGVVPDPGRGAEI